MKFYTLWAIFLTSCLATADQPVKVKSLTSQLPSAGLYSKNVSRPVAVQVVDDNEYGDDDDDDDDDFGTYEGGSGDSSLEKITEAKVLRVEDDGSVGMTSKKADDIVFEDEEDYGYDDDDDDEEDNDEEVNVNEKSEGGSRFKSVTAETDENNKDDFLYDFNYGFYDDDEQEDLNDSRTVVPSVKLPSDEAPTVDSNVTFERNGSEDTSKEVSTTFLMSLIAGSAVISFVAFMVAFFIYSRTLRNKRKQKLQSFSAPSEACVLTSPSVWSSPIVKSYQQVSTSCN